MIDTSWSVLHVNSNQEKRVLEHLVARSINCYLPLYTERNRWTDRNVVVQRPLFPGYVFTRFPSEAKTLVVSTPGVFRVLGDAVHHRVPADEIEKIQAGLAGGLCLRPHTGVSIGMRVRVCNGVFAGAQGTVKELRKQCRVILSVANVQQLFSLEVRADDLEVLRGPLAATAQRMPIGC